MSETALPVAAPERTMPKPVIAAGLVLVGVVLGIGIAAKLLPTRKVLYPVEGPPRPCADCAKHKAQAEKPKAEAPREVEVVESDDVPAQ